MESGNICDALAFNTESRRRNIDNVQENSCMGFFFDTDGFFPLNIIDNCRYQDFFYTNIIYPSPV